MESLEKILIAALVNNIYQRDEYLVSHLLSDGYTKYSFDDVNRLANPKEAEDYNNVADFSNSIYEMPNTIDFKKENKFLWQQLYFLFNLREIIFAKQDHDKKDIQSISSKVRDKIGASNFEKFFSKNSLYSPTLNIVEKGEIEFKSNFTNEDLNSLRLMVNSDLTSEEVLQLKNISNELLSEQEYYYSAIWGFWKNMFNSKYEVADFKSPSSYSGFYYANYSLLLDDAKWDIKTFNIGQIGIILNKSVFSKYTQQIIEKLKNYDQISFKVQKLDIQQSQWFTPAMFDARFWDVKNEIISNGKLEGDIPTYIDEVIFIKEVKSTLKVDILKDSLRWLGELIFGKRDEDYPKFFSEVQEDDKNNILLVAYLCKIVPKCPNPDPNLNFA